MGRTKFLSQTGIMWTMDNAEQFEQELMRFGLSKYESKVLIALLVHGPQTASRVVKLSGIPQPRIYDVFSSLSRKGFVESTSGRKKLYRAIPVQSSLGKYVNDLDKFVKRLDVEIENIKSIKPVKAYYIWTIEGPQNIDARIGSMIHQARSEIILSVDRRKLRNNLQAIRNASDHGITVALVVFDDVDQETINLIPSDVIVNRRAGRAAEIVMVDRALGLVDLGIADDPEDYAIYFDDNKMLHLLSYYFYLMVWQNSRDTLRIPKLSHYTLNNIWLTCEIIDSFIKDNISLSGEVDGIMNGTSIHLIGKVTGTKVQPGVQQTFFLECADRTYSVGGKTAVMEDVRMTKITLKMQYGK